MTAAGWIFCVAVVAAFIAAGFGIGHWIECRGRDVVAEVEEFDTHNFDPPDTPEPK